MAMASTLIIVMASTLGINLLCKTIVPCLVIQTVHLLLSPAQVARLIEQARVDTETKASKGCTGCINLLP